MSVQPLTLRRPPVSVFIAAGDERVRTALWRLLEGEEGIEPLGATADLADLLRLLGRVTPAAVVVDESIFGAAGVRWLPMLARAAPCAALVVVGMHDHPAFVTRARDAGAADYVRLDDADRLGRVVVAASERALPSAAGRRRAGRRAVTVVPDPGADSMSRLPPRSSTRSRIPATPKPPDEADGSNP